VSLYGHERIVALQAAGHPIAPGTTGENLTIAGLDWSALAVGDCFRIGDDVCIVITSYAVPCKNIAGSFCDGNFSRLSQKLHPGWSRLYARVVREGLVRPGDAVVFDIDDQV
jgi:MOSC domain-containing protein YiiM